MRIANIFKELREEKNLTQKELSKACGISPQCISAIETGRNDPTASTLLAYANYFKISIDELLNRVDEFTPAERAAGLTDTVKVSVTPLEDDMLYEFRQVGKKRGEEAQRALITIAKSMQ